ncbi:MAG TPA: hypothetical protein VKV02_11530 [Acidobacteriaceae bacterium]|nr:hypothetical protein [Acidobacteriaceae bacterium]
MVIELPRALEQQLNEAARLSSCSAEEIAQHAIEDYLASFVEDGVAITQARADVAAVRLLSQDEVRSRIERLLAH